MYQKLFPFARLETLFLIQPLIRATVYAMRAKHLSRYRQTILQQTQ